jgi:hypothetical protein
VIPVLIVPVLDRWNDAAAMLATVPDSGGRVVVIDNDQSGSELGSPCEYIRPLINVGFSGAINAAIAQTPEAPWWMWASVDLRFAAADLTNIAHLMEDARGPRVVTGDRADERLLRFAYAAINRDAIEAVGLLDEWSFFPIYYEDDDYERRCRLGGVEWVEYNGQISHQRSATISAPVRERANAVTFPENGRRYAAKWGGPPGSERFSRPWDLPVPLDYTRPDIAGRARRLWK